MHRLLLPGIACLALFVSPPSIAGAAASSSVASEVVGKEKARIDLSKEWTAVQIDPDLGPHQWIRGNGAKQTILVVQEELGLFMEESDFLSNLGVSTELLRANLGDDCKVSQPTFRERDDFKVASVSADGEVEGTKLHFELSLVGRDGLGYLLMVWTERRNRKDAEEAMEEIIGSFEMPGGRSRWQRGLKPRKRTASAHSQRVSISVAPSLLEEDENPGDGFLGFTSSDSNFIVYLFEYSSFDSLDEVIDVAIETLAEDWDSLTPLRRSSLELAGRPARTGAYLGEYNGATYFTESYVLEIGPDQMIELRMLSDGKDGAHAALRKSLVDSLEVSNLSAKAAFPEPDPSSLGQDDLPKLSPEPDRERLLSISKEHAPLDESARYLRQITADKDGFFLTSRGKIMRFDLEKSNFEWLLDNEESGSLGGATRSGGTVYVIAKGEVCSLENGLLTPLDVSAKSVAAFGRDGLLLHREFVHSDLLGFENSFPTESQLIVRSAAGKERVTFSSRHWRIRTLAVQGKHALIALAQKHEWSQQVDLMVMEVGKGGEPTKTESWGSVTGIFPAHEGWLVSGTPVGETPGTYLMDTDGKRRRILDLDHISPLCLGPDDTLYFAESGREGMSDPLTLRSVSLGELAKARIFQAPWSPGDLAALALEALPPEGLANTGDDAARRWMPFLERAEALSRKRFGCGFPTHPVAVDQLIGGLAMLDDLPGDARDLLVAIVIRALSEQGATWALVPGITPTGVIPSAYTYGNELSLGINVASAVFQVGNPDSEAFRIVQETLGALNGRELLMGTDSASIHRAVDAARNRLTTLRFEDVELDALKTMTDAAPENALLRTRIYEQLILCDRSADAQALAEHHAGRPDASVTDIALSISGRELTRESADAAIEALKGAIARSPYTADLYVLLGEAYEKQGARDSKELAYACFAHALDILYYDGPLQERAEAGKERTSDF